jgi:L-arabinose 1-dehydrogenase [NAD(P)+]
MTHQVVVTGAAGSVGRETLEALSTDAFEVTPVTHRLRDDIDSIVLNIVDEREKLAEAFDGNETVIHLAGNPSPNADWEGVLDTNIRGTYNIFEAARKTGIDRVVFASTNHVQHMYNIGEPDRPELTKPNPRPVHPDDPPRPDSYYGISKLTGEGLGSFYADRYDIDVLNLRIGWLLTQDELLDYQDGDAGRARQARVMWLSPRDWRDAARRTVTADIDGVHTVNVLSGNQERYFSLTETMRTLDYHPRDDATDVVEQHTD